MFSSGIKKYNDVLDCIWGKFCVIMNLKFSMTFESPKTCKMGTNKIRL